MSFCEERLRDVFGLRGCIIFLPHSLERLCDFFCGEVGGCMIFVVESLCDFFVGCVTFFWWRGCVWLRGEVTTVVKRWRDFLCEEVA